MIRRPLPLCGAFIAALVICAPHSGGAAQAAGRDAIELAGPISAQANPQLAQSVEKRLRFYKIQIDGAKLSRQQAAALHILLSESRKPYLDIRRRAKVILTAERFR